MRGTRGVRATGISQGVDADEGRHWRVRYDILWDHRWRFRAAVIRLPERVLRIRRDDADGWRVDGVDRPDLAASVDIDLQVSLLTNAAPVHRFTHLRRQLPAPAAYVTSALDVDLVEQTYRRLPGRGVRFVYHSPDHGFRATLRFGADEFVLEYPGLGRRA